MPTSSYQPIPLPTAPAGDDGDLASLREERSQAAQTLQRIMDEHGVAGQITATTPASRLTRFEITLAPGAYLAQLGALAEECKRSLHRPRPLRMLLPVPGRNCAGVEVPFPAQKPPAPERLFADPAWRRHDGRLLPLLLGDSVDGLRILDLAASENILIAGYDGAGKSTLLQQFLLSLVLIQDPADTRVLLFDRNGETFRDFAKTPHLALPVQKTADAGVTLLEWSLQETNRRRRLLAAAGCRRLEEYAPAEGQERLPRYLLLFDEIGALMDPRHQQKTLELLQGLADSAAAGIHLAATTSTLPQAPVLNCFSTRILGFLPQEKPLQPDESTQDEEPQDEDVQEEGDIPDTTFLMEDGDFLLCSGEDRLRFQSASITPEFRAAICQAAQEQAPRRNDPAPQLFLQRLQESQKALQEATHDKEMPQLHFTEPTANDALRAILSAGKATPQVVAEALAVSSERAANLLDELTFHEYLSAPDAVGARQIRREKIPGEFLGKAETTRKTLESLLAELEEKIRQGDPNSRTVAEYNKGVHAIGKKIVEEAAEVWMAAEYENADNVSLEISQLLYHLMVLMLRKKIPLEDIYKKL